MQSSTIGKKLVNIDGGAKILRLTAKGQKVKFRLASGDFSYSAKHIMQSEDGSWQITECPRLMYGESCEYCDRMFQAIRKLKEDENDKDAIAQKRLYSPKTEFYYWIIDRDDSELKVLQTTLSVRIGIDKEAKELEESSSSIFSFDYTLERTEQPGGGYYLLKRVDSSLTKELSEDEKSGLKEAKETDIGTVVKSGAKKSDEPLRENVDFEKVMGDAVEPADDLPF